MKLKFNGGKGALLCDNCGVILVTGKRIPDEVYKTQQYNLLYFCCEDCKTQFINKTSTVINPENGIENQKNMSRL
jgi:RNase P subunit RPR2